MERERGREGERERERLRNGMQLSEAQIESAMGLASIYSARGKHEMAEPLLQQVLEWRDARQDRSSIHL